MKRSALIPLYKLFTFLLITALILVSVSVNAKQNKKIKEKELPFVNVVRSEAGFQLEGDSCETLYKEIFQFDKLFVKYDRPDGYVRPLCIESIRSVNIESLERMIC